MGEYGSMCVCVCIYARVRVCVCVCVYCVCVCGLRVGVLGALVYAGNPRGMGDARGRMGRKAGRVGSDGSTGPIPALSNKLLSLLITHQRLPMTWCVRSVEFGTLTASGNYRTGTKDEEEDAAAAATATATADGAGGGGKYGRRLAVACGDVFRFGSALHGSM